MPVLNASIDGDNIVYHKDVNIGIAVALDWGLIVPVIRNADEKDLAALSRAIADLAERARSKQLKPDEVTGGTFTITNPGVFGALFGMPIINQPQVAILAVGTIEKRPAVRDDAVVVRTLSYLSLGYDHRVIDGAVADEFMFHIKHTVENWDPAALNLLKCSCMRALEVRRLGTVRYVEALDLQSALVEDRRAGRIGDVLLLLEHPHVLTLGVRGDGGRSHILATPEALDSRGVEVHETGRGGDITYHGPGQIVGYPIIDLKPDRRDVHRYVRDLEEVLIRAAGDCGIRATRMPGLTGVWVGEEKLAAIGVRIARWITCHGFAFNVSTDLAYFNLIVPCGIADRGVTSLAELGVSGKPRRGRGRRCRQVLRGVRPAS